ncbi:Hypothetical predicted protein [Mytilus galloprovincialis]|uniref:Uncharacterized protein n=1 Tax=Mytilus galloprovincialis TaxID=29158 RepID=A0A8B6C0I9_MYTGA|nr:Hypothetical predicted protein [Mytilus galloprovincialis]
MDSASIKTSNIAENLDTCLDQIDYILKRNATLTTYIDNIEKQHYSNSGKKFDDLQPRQRLRKLKTLESYGEKALSFANTFGLNPTRLDCISDAGKKVSLNLSDSPSKDSYDTLHASEKDNLRQLVFLFDKFCVSDIAYHELSMLFDNMPRKYIVSQSRNDINKIFHLERLPGNMPGAMINLDTELKRVIKQNFQNLSNVTKLDIKFSGGSTGNFACPWCKVHNRFDTSKAWDFYHNVDMLRSIDEIVTLSSQSKSQFGVKHRPLLKIDVDYYVPDELHLMLRVSDILLRNMINDCKNKDDKIRKEIKSGCKPINIDNFEDLVQSCGVVFHICTPKGSNDLEWTSLSGGEKIKLLKYLPEKLLNSDVLKTDTKEKVVWQDFYAIYLFVCSK